MLLLGDVCFGWCVLLFGVGGVCVVCVCGVCVFVVVVSVCFFG